MYVVDNDTMRRIDAATIAAGTPGIDLMERAGGGAAQRILARPRWLEGTTLIVCGKGNNGGDGLVVARWLHAVGRSVCAVVLAEADNLSADTATNLDRARACGLRLEHVPMADAPGALSRLHDELPGTLVVDALLGTGLTLPLRGATLDVVAALNALPRRRVALDCPSGVDASTGSVDPDAVRAHLTLTFGLPKRGLLLGEGRGHSGRVECIDLGFPEEIMEAEVARGDAIFYVDHRRAAQWWRPRPIDAHKFDAGTVAVMGGASGMSGAVALASLAALRGGAGLVTAFVPGSQRLAVDILCPEVLVHGVAETDGGGLAPVSGDYLAESAARRDVLLLGPGAGPDLATATLLLDLIAVRVGSLVVDADGLNAFSRLQREPRFTGATVLTPHSGELARLMGVETEELESRRRERVAEFSAASGAVVLHKGAPALVAAPDGRVALLGSGGPGLATAGSGDVLAGVVAALLASGAPAFEAACVAAFLHGRAGDLAEMRRGVAGVLARDVLEELGTAILEIDPPVVAP